MTTATEIATGKIYGAGLVESKSGGVTHLDAGHVNHYFKLMVRENETRRNYYANQRTWKDAARKIRGCKVDGPRYLQHQETMERCTKLDNQYRMEFSRAMQDTRQYGEILSENEGTKYESAAWLAANREMERIFGVDYAHKSVVG